MSSFAERQALFQSLRDQGMNQRESSIASFPDMPVDSAMIHGAAIVEQPTVVDAAAVSNGRISAGAAKMKTIQQLVSGGVESQAAISYASQIYDNAPETFDTVDYERMSKIIGKSLDDRPVPAIDRAMSSGQFVQDADFMMTAIGAIFGGVQQGAFGFMAGERASKAWERVFPDADIRDPDGVVRQKSVLAESVKGLALGAAGTIMSAVAPALPHLGLVGEASKSEARDVALGLLKSDYKDDLLTGNEVIEYWIHGDGLMGTKLPDPGTPERQLYDAKLREEVAQAYASADESPFGKAALGAIAFNGALMDVFADPAIVLSEVPKATVLGLRKLAPVSSTARITSAIADRTRRTTDVLVAVADAQKWVDSTAEKLKATPTDAALAHHEHAKKTLVRQTNLLNARRAAEIEGETVLLRTNPRINPKHIKDVAKSYLGSDPKQRAAMTKSFIADQIREASAAVKDSEKFLAEERALLADAEANPNKVYRLELEDGTVETMTAAEMVERTKITIPDTEDALKSRIPARDEWKETQKWFKSRASNPQSRTESVLTEAVNQMEPYQPRVIQPKMEEGGVSYSLAATPDVSDIMEYIGPGPIAGVLSKFNAFATSLHVGASAVDVRDALRGLLDVMRDSKFNLNDLTVAHARVLAEREGITFDEALDEADAVWMRLAQKFESARSGSQTPSAHGEYAAKIVAAMANQEFKELESLTQEVLDLTSGVGSTGRPLKAMQGEGANVNTGNATAGSGQTKWDMLVEREAARANQVRYPDQTVAELRREVLNNIKRGEAQGAPHEEILQWMDRYTQLSRMPDQKAPVTELITRSTRTADEILREALLEQRRNVASGQPSPSVDLYGMDPVQMRQRVAYGPDQAEAAEDAMRALTEGAEIDDIAFYGVGLDLLNTSYGNRVTGASGTEGRNLGVRKKVRGEMQDVPNTTLSRDEWLGKDLWRTKVERAQWQQSMAEKLGDFYTRGLYPGTWNVKPAMWLMNVREPMRVLQSMSPRLYTRIHDAMNAQHVELTRMTEIFSRDLKTLGVYTEVNGSFVKDPEKSQKFYEILNLKPDTEDFNNAMAMLTARERLAVSHIRREFDFMRSKLGIEGTDLDIEGYMPHVFDPRWHDNGARPMEIRGTGANADVFDPYLIERTGKKGYEKDLALALDAYSRAASRKLHLEPLFTDMRAAASAHLKANPGDKWFVSYIEDMVNNFKGMPSSGGVRVDRWFADVNAHLRARQAVMDVGRGAGTMSQKLGTGMANVGGALSHVPGKIGRFGGALKAEGVRTNEFGSKMALDGVPLYNTGDASRTAMMVTALAYSSVLAGSSRYFPMAVATGLATTGSRYGIFNTVRGIMAMGTDEGRALAKQAGIDKQWANIMEDAAWTKLGHLSASMPSFNGVTVVGPSITATENLVRGWTFHAALGDMMRKGGMQSWDDVVEAGLAKTFMHEAVRVTEEVNHVFGQLGKPPLMSRVSKSGSAAASQFLSFIPKQLEELMAQGMENPGKIAQYMMISGYMQRVTAKTGIDVSDYVGSGFLPESPDDATSISFEAIASLVEHTGNLAKLQSGTGDAKATRMSEDRVKRSLQMFVPLAMATHRFKRAEDALRLGALYTDEGTKIRDYDLGGFKWDDSISRMENLANLPQGMLSASGDPSRPTELASILTGMSSTQQRMERQAHRAGMTAARNVLYRKAELADGLRKMAREGNSADFSQQLRKMIAEGMLVPDIENMAERTYLEHALPRLMREQISSDQSQLDYIDILQRQRALHDLQFGYSEEQK